MKRGFIIFLMILFFAGNCFGQSSAGDPVGLFYKFWDLALSNDVESAKKFALGNSIKSNDYEQIRKNFEIIFENKLKVIKTGKTEVYPTQAFFNFEAKGKNEIFFSGQMLLFIQNNEWKILFFDIKRVSRFEITEENKTPPKLPPWLPKGFPVKKECPKCA